MRTNKPYHELALNWWNVSTDLVQNVCLVFKIVWKLIVDTECLLSRCRKAINRTFSKITQLLCIAAFLVLSVVSLTIDYRDIWIIEMAFYFLFLCDMKIKWTKKKVCISAVNACLRFILKLKFYWKWMNFLWVFFL